VDRKSEVEKAIENTQEKLRKSLKQLEAEFVKKFMADFWGDIEFDNSRPSDTMIES